MPDTLKSGIENLSGLSLDGVKVHYNSPEPDKIDALAFARGNEIHLAPGQEMYLPHEAWHVVQQREGRVAPTFSEAGVSLNDDRRLEQEAHERGRQALGMSFLRLSDTTAAPPVSDGPLTGGGGSTGRRVMQREKKHFPTVGDADPTVVKYKPEVDPIVDEIDATVIQSRNLALQWRNYLDSPKPHLKNWALAAKAYFENPLVAPEFIHALFGYAVEQLTCDTLHTDRGALFIDFQVTSGNTRPDIVIKVKENLEQLAWLDITSKDSQNHILGKSGSGWKTRPFVYEILYDPLKLSEVLTASSDPVFLALGNYLSESHEIVYEEHAKKLQELRNSLLGLKDTEKWETGLGNASAKKQATKTHLADTLGMGLGPSSLIATKGALSLADINSGPYGFGGADHGSTLAAKQWINATTAPTIKARQDAMEDQLLHGIMDDTADRQDDLPPVGDFFSSYWDANPDARDRVMTGLAIQVTVDRAEKLEGLVPGIDVEDPSQLQQNAQTHLGLMPKKADAKQLQGWVNTADLITQAGERFDQLEALKGQPLPGVDVRVQQMQDAIEQQADLMPGASDDGALRTWIQQADALIGQRELLRQTFLTQQALILYLQNKYHTPLNIFMRTPQESELLMRLSDMPQNNSVILKAQQHMV
jgi:hypothetical protein